MNIDVVYLAYLNEEAHYTIDVIKNFFNTYKKFQAGIDYSLIIIAKNWTDKNLYSQLCSMAKEYKAKIIDLPDDGWDIGAYYRVAKILKSQYILFLGSSTLIMSNNWLSKLYSPFIKDKSIQLVGAMGSLEAGHYREFPNPHIRTCSFMIKRTFLLEYASKHKFPITKDDTYEFEHGKDSITNFILNKGYKAVVVNSDGEIFEPGNWAFSKTFRYPNEWKTILADKLSAYYYACTPKIKILSEELTWGKTIKELTEKQKTPAQIC